MGADLRAIFWATSCFLGTFCAVDFLAVCFVLAINYDYSSSTLIKLFRAGFQIKKDA